MSTKLRLAETSSPTESSSSLDRAREEAAAVLAKIRANHRNVQDGSWTLEEIALLIDGRRRGANLEVVAKTISTLCGRRRSRSSLTGFVSRYREQLPIDIRAERRTYGGPLPMAHGGNRSGMPERHHGCQFILRREPPFSDADKCGARVWRPGASYCAAHHAMCVDGTLDAKRMA